MFVKQDSVLTMKGWLCVQKFEHTKILLRWVTELTNINVCKLEFPSFVYFLSQKLLLFGLAHIFLFYRRYHTRMRYILSENKCLIVGLFLRLIARGNNHFFPSTQWFVLLHF